MKIIIFIAAFLMPLIALSQSKRNVEKLVNPVFLDSRRLIEEFSKDQGLKQIYLELQNHNDHVVLNHGFRISPRGKVEPYKWEGDSRLNAFIDRFNTYRWKAAYKRGCPSCKRISYAMLEIYIIPFKNMIQLRMTAGDGNILPKLIADEILNITLTDLDYQNNP